MGESRCGGVAVWEIRNVGESRCGRVAAWGVTVLGSRGVGELRYVRVPVVTTP